MKITNDPLPGFDWAELSKENKFVTIPAVLSELNGLSKSKKRKTSRRAANTLSLIEGKKIVDSIANKTEFGDADIALLEFVRARPKDRALATMDGSLLSRLEKLGLPYLTLSRGRALFKTKPRANIFN
jgi:rRNA-processing protein FCF1